MVQSNAEWQSWCRAAKHMEAKDSSVIVWFGERRTSRKHEVAVREMPDGYELEALVVGAGVTRNLLEADRDLRMEAWARNRSTRLVGFRVDRRDRLLVEAVMPKTGVTSDEFRLYVQAVATEADRLELLLTGKDEQ